MNKPDTDVFLQARADAGLQNDNPCMICGPDGPVGSGDIGDLSNELDCVCALCVEKLKEMIIRGELPTDGLIQ